MDSLVEGPYKVINGSPVPHPCLNKNFVCRPCVANSEITKTSSMVFKIFEELLDNNRKFHYEENYIEKECTGVREEKSQRLLVSIVYLGYVYGHFWTLNDWISKFQNQSILNCSKHWIKTFLSKSWFPWRNTFARREQFKSNRKD